MLTSRSPLFASSAAIQLLRRSPLCLLAMFLLSRSSMSLAQIPIPQIEGPITVSA